MEKFMSFMDKYIVPVAAKIGAQRHLVAVRDAFIYSNDTYNYGRCIGNIDK